MLGLGKKMSFKEITQGLVMINIIIPMEGFDNFMAAWLIRDSGRGQIILAETGPSSSLPELYEDLDALGAENIDYLIFTHVHLDHSGGAGQFHEKFPDTKIIAPDNGRVHLLIPDKLYLASAKTLGTGIVRGYGEPKPLPGSAFTGKTPEGLTIIETPGHSSHHAAFLYELSGKRILFSGEAAGFFYKLPDGGIYQRPATPHRFFYDTAIESLDRLTELGDVDIICYPHYGCAVGSETRSALENARSQLILWKRVISDFAADADVEKIFNALHEKDALLRGVDKLDKKTFERESFFIRQSIRGLMGYIFR